MAARTTLSHVTIITGDFEASRAVYDAVLGTLGLSSTVEYSDPEAEDGDPGSVAAAGYGLTDAPPMLWLVAGLVPTRGAHVALTVASRDEVLAAHRAAVEAGAEVIQAPRDWEQAQLNYFGTQLRDPGDNILEVQLTRTGPDRAG